MGVTSPCSHRYLCTFGRVLMYGMLGVKVYWVMGWGGGVGEGAKHHRQSDEYWNCFKGNVGETSERRG